MLALLWWSWVGYTWLTSVVDPEEGLVRLAIFAAMAALLIVALSVPDVFGDHAVWFAVAYGAVRVAHIGLFLLASRDDPALRRSVGILALGVGTSVTLLLAGSLLGGAGQWVLWIAALAVDMGVPYLFGSAGWRLTPAHFAERHWLVVIIALGESVVALGVGADVGLDLGVAVAGVLGIALVCELLVDLLRRRRDPGLAPTDEPRGAGRERNELARDVYSYMHFLLVAGIVLAAFGLHEVLPHVDEPLEAVPAFALLGGVALYLLGHVAMPLPPHARP